MNSEGITVVGANIYDVRAKLGMSRGAMIAISLVGEKPSVRVSCNGETRVFDSPRKAMQYAAAALLKSIPKPKKKAAKKRRAR